MCRKGDAWKGLICLKEKDGNGAQFKKGVRTMEFFGENMYWRNNLYLSKYDCGSMQDYTTLSDCPSADEKGIFGRFHWSRYGNNILITGVQQDSVGAVIDIPSAINGYPVKGIADKAFMNRMVFDIYIPDSVAYIGALAIGFIAFPVYNDNDEERIKKEKPFAHNRPTSTLQDFTYYLHQSPKTQIHGTKNSTAEKYANKHQLLFVSI